ncbi:MAG TPA: CHC2 zinc finger domain-containing protein, partial [Fibrobacteraceae bacterium]|nr:CHC2 zinc finger domain-containing protein [Fibrobacteraceae bacterium]
MTKSQDPPKPEFLYSRQKLRSVITPRRLSLNLERLGRKWVSTCPFHQPAEKSLYFFDSLGYWEFKCTQCGMGGDLIDYISHIHFPHLDADQARDASIVHWVQLLSNSEKATLSEVTETTTGLQSGVNERSKVLDAFVQYCAYALENNANAREWLASHGWTLEQSRLFGLGHFDGEIDPFLDYCALHGLDQSLVFFYLDQLDSQRNPCMTFPARNSKGQIYTVYGMDLIPVGARSPVEYWPLSSVNGDVPFNISPGIDHPIVVPELWDVMAAELQGISGVVSLLGRPLTPGHLHKLKAGGSESLTLILEQGEGRSRRPVQDLEQDLQLATSLGLSFKSVLLPKGYTVASYLHHHGVEEFNQLLQSTAPDTSRTRRRASLMQEIGSCYEENMSREPGSGRGWSLEQFPQLSRRLHGIRPGYHLILSNAFFDKAFFLTALGLDLVESNPCKMIYITLE